MRIILLSFFLISSTVVFSRDKYTLSGYIKDKSNGEALIGASVYVNSLKTGAITNEYGFYSISLPSGDYEITYSFIGYTDTPKEINLDKNLKLNISLSETDQILKAVDVFAERPEDNVNRVEMSMEKMPMKLVKSLPAFMGEVDVIKTLQYLPGVSCGGEGSAGIYVRGGGSDQNLILLDEAPVYNASHLLGFFSVFNSDIVKDMKIYKGGIPAEHGGRLSSLIDIRMKEGSNQKFRMGGGIGLLASRLNMEIPVVKGRSSLIIAGRRTYADQFLQFQSDEQIKQNKLYFYDLNTKFNYTISDNDRLFVSGYYGRDVFKFRNNFEFEWGNYTSTVRWNHIFGQKLFSNLTLLYSSYDYNLNDPDKSDPFKWEARLQNVSAKLDFTYYLNPSNTIKLGISSIYHSIDPGKFTPYGNSYFTEVKTHDTHALEHAGYICNEQKIGDRITLKYGLRYSRFQQIGSAVEFLYENPDRPEKNELIDSLAYNSWKPIKTYQGLEPRFAANIKLDENSSLKMSYNRTMQYLHLVSNTNSPTPLDIWVPSSRYIKPQIANQGAIGYFRNFLNNTVETSVEAYYKDMCNQIDYKDGANLLLNKHVETEMLIGTAYSYGVELMVKKNVGRFTGWFSYTFSRTRKKIDGINEGREYSSSHDRTHDLSVITSYKLDDRWTVSANWVLASGTPTTYPVAKYKYEGASIPVYSERNSYRLPTYHRLDLGATYVPRSSKPKRWKNSWSFSLFNVYARRNAYSVSFRPTAQNPTVTEAVRLSIIGTVIPSVTYNFNF